MLVHCMYECIYVCLSVSVREWCVCVCVCVLVCVYVCMYVCVQYAQVNKNTAYFEYYIRTLNYFYFSCDTVHQEILILVGKSRSCIFNFWLIFLKTEITGNKDNDPRTQLLWTFLR
jgi:hypothetical protein